jgi:hypothetical protein
MQKIFHSAKPFLILALSSWVLAFSVVEFETIAWGSGIWLGQFSFKWALAFLVFVLFCVSWLGSVVVLLWSPERLTSLIDRFSHFRERLGLVRWILAILILISPVWLLQFTFYGAVLYRPYLRILLWGLSTVFLGSLLTKGTKELLTWRSLLTALVLTSGIFNFVVPLAGVTSYPMGLFGVVWRLSL